MSFARKTLYYLIFSAIITYLTDVQEKIEITMEILLLQRRVVTNKQ